MAQWSRRSPSKQRRGPDAKNDAPHRPARKRGPRPHTRGPGIRPPPERASVPREHCLPQTRSSPGLRQGARTGGRPVLAWGTQRGGPAPPPGPHSTWESTEPLSAAKSAAVRFGAIGNGCTRRLPDSQSGRGRGAGVSLHQRGQRGSGPRGGWPGLGHLPDSEGASPASARPSTPLTPCPAQRTLGRRICSRPGPAQDSKEENEPQKRRAGGENRHGVPPPVQGSFLPQAPPSVPELKAFIRVPESGTKNQRFLPEQKVENAIKVYDRQESQTAEIAESTGVDGSGSNSAPEAGWPWASPSHPPSLGCPHPPTGHAPSMLHAAAQAGPGQGSPVSSTG